MDTRTFILGTKMTLTVPISAIKAIDVQPAGKGVFIGHTVVNGGGLGNLRVRLDVPRIIDLSQNNDLEEVTRWLTFSVFSGNNAVPITAATRLSAGGGSDPDNTTTPGPGMDIK
jgi:hypothetical protein